MISDGDDKSGADTGNDEDVRLWWITFSASLAAIVGGAMVLGISLALIRAFRHLTQGERSFAIFLLLGALLFFGVLFRRIGSAAKMRDFLASTDSGVLVKIFLIVYAIVALAWVLVVIGLAAGVK